MKQRIAVAVFLFALLLRVLYLVESSGNPTFELPIVDSGDYYEMAREFFETRSIDKLFFYQPFFYPSFLSLVCLFFKSPIITAKLIQAVVGSLTCLLTFLLGKKVFGLRSGILAGAIAALYGPLVFYGGELLAASWAAFWSVALILLLIEAGERKSAGLFFVLGLCGGLSAITRPNFVPFFLAGSIWLAVVFRRRVVRGLVFLLAGFLLIALPVAFQNYRLTGAFSILPASGGINLYLGNNPDPCRTLSARPGEEFQRIRDLPKGEGPAGRREEGSYFYRRTLDYLLDQPFSFLVGLARKTVRFCSSRETPRTVNIYVFRRWSRLLSLLVWKVGGFGFPFGVLLPLAACGIVYRRKEIPAPLYLFLIIYPLTIVLVHVSGRYRLAAIPPLIAVGAAGLEAVIGMAREKKWRRLAGAVVLMAGALLLSTLPGPFCEEKVNYYAELYAGLGGKHYQAGRVGEATAAYREALRIRPDYPHAHNNLGAIFAEEGELEEAISHYRAALRIDPAYAEARVNLGAALGREGRLDEAISQYRLAVEEIPFSAVAHNNLGASLARRGEMEEAVVHYREALRLNPDYADAHNNLGAALGEEGKLEEALFHFNEALRIEPGNLKSLHNRSFVFEKLKAGGKR